MSDSAALRPKTYSYLTDDKDENKKQKGQILCHKTKFLHYKNCLEAMQLKNKKIPLRKKLDVDSFKIHYKKFIKTKNLLKKLTALHWVVTVIKNTVSQFNRSKCTLIEQRPSMSKRKN